MKQYLRLLQYLKPYRLRIAEAVVCMIFTAAANLYMPWIIKDMIDKVLAEKDMATLNLICIGVIVIFFARGFFYYGQSYLISHVGQRIVLDIRNALFSKFQRLPIAYFDRHQTGEVMSYITNDVATVQNALVDKLIDIVTEGAIFIGSLVMMFMLDWRLSLMTLVTVPLVGVSMKVFGRMIRRSGAEIQSRLSDFTAMMQESLSAERVVKAFGRERYEIDRYYEQNEQTFAASMQNVRLTSILTPTIEFIAALAATALIWVGGKEVVDGRITAGTLVAFLTYAVNMSNPLKRLSRAYAGIQQALAGADRVFGILDMEEPISDRPGAILLPSAEGHVRVEDVTFSYKAGVPALSHVSLAAKPGQMIAFVGPSGAGKSTIANLIPRFYDVDSGAIFVDGHDIRDLTLESLRAQIGIVPQETMLFSTTVRENIRYGMLDATDEEIEAAARDANAHEFIMELPEGYDTQIGERGLMLSGGQRQRIAIARAILKDPKILILDEATSALDTESEKIVQAALDRLMIGRTAFVIAHRLSTIFGADQIYVIDHGTVREHGTHEELLAAKGLYAELYALQFKK
jgi:subfamily B ATP-binding cassette protein MsbA